MNDEHLESVLASASKQVHAPKHRTALRAALLREHERGTRSSFTRRVSHYISMKTAFIPVTAFAVLTVVVIGTFGLTQKSAEAQELVQRSMTRAAQLTPAFRAQIEAQLKADMMDALKEAYAAPDLRILTREEYEKEAQFTMSTSSFGVRGTVQFHAEEGARVMGDAPFAVSFRTDGPVNEETQDIVFDNRVEPPTDAHPIAIAIRNTEFVPGEPIGTGVAGVTGVPSQIEPPVKYLRYTDPEGRKVTLGLDKNDTPVFRIEELIQSDVVPGPDGSVSIQGKVLKMIRVNTQAPDGGYSEAGAVSVSADQ